jgi:hypothetical protein
MRKRRVQLYADDHIIRRIEVAAQKHNMAISAYCLTAIEHQLDEDGIESDDILPTTQSQFENVLQEIKELQAQILQERAGQIIDVDSLLDGLREERDEEALGLR